PGDASRAAPVVTPEQLAPLNSAAPDAAETALLACCGSRRWARRVAAHRPYPDLDALLAASDEAAYDLSPSDLAEALTCEPLDPGVPRQGAAPGTYGAADTALRAAHAAYESRFGHTFVICLDDVAPGEALDHLLSGIRSRLGNDPEEERAVAADELRRLARGRLIRLASRTAPATSDDAEKAGDGGPGHAARAECPQARPDSPYVPV
ncbi:2-oxo-4-hydroxy-4-carboxy-5-ureidoimidazoline decarboxylase, partial [Streptomyces flavofungini]|uniref:2-oxo-4-hydroxy-4-carboxy-5-ureidoimidazoline decarboxylase n=1 Tax=Streptomyces flavofungini TaxID=68200 RepID=UPI003F7ED397